MPDVKVISSDLDASTNGLIQMLKGLPPDVFNRHPDKKSWSVADVVDHLLKLEGGINGLLLGPTTKAERDPEGKVLKIEEVFLDFDKKLSAGGPVKPSGVEKQKDRLIAQISESRENLAKIVGEKDLKLIYTGFRHPIFGLLSGIEWVYFAIYHSQRHLHQIKKILATVN